MTSMRANLLQWQWSNYSANHTTRANLIVHVVTVPIFQLGTISLFASPLTLFASGPGAAVMQAFGGLLSMVVVMALQGRMHRKEPTPPVPFEGATDVVSRILVEQWITFPRFVFQGGLSRAWREASPSGP